MSTENELRIVKRLTGVDDNRIEVNETGWTSRVYVIDNGKVVFKFPRNAQFRKDSIHDNYLKRIRTKILHGNKSSR